MKKTLLTAFTAGLLALALTVPASAAKGNKADKATRKAEREEKQKVLSTFDKNANGQIDDDEKEALRKAFETDTSLKSLDKNTDGKLDDDEIAAVKAHKKGEGKKGAGKKKKNAA